MIAPAAFAALLWACALASEPDVPNVERRAAKLGKVIMCPVCPGESISQSQNPLAVQMRAIVREKLEDGWSDRQIQDFLVERYGPSVLLEPPAEGFGLAAWIVPPVAFALAIAALLLTLKWMRMSAEASADSGADEQTERRAYVSRIEEALRPDSAPGAARDGDERDGTAKP